MKMKLLFFSLTILLFLFSLPGKAQTTFSNTGAISIPNNGQASPYPSAITVSGLLGSIINVTVTLNGFSHDFPSDVDILLVAPDGTNITLMSDAGGGTSVTGINIGFDDAAVGTVDEPIVDGTYQPTNTDNVGDSWPPPAPVSPSGLSTLSNFNGITPNGVWSLYVVDAASGDAGSIDGGWSITITSDIVLPVYLLTFKASQSANAINLNWTSATEINMKHYELERSANATVFNTIANVPPHKTNGLNNYSWTDVYAFAGANFYRLKMVNMDGSFKYSQVIKVNKAAVDQFMTVYPNPVKEKEFVLQLQNVPAGKYELLLYNNTGQVILTKNMDHTGGSASETISLPATITKGSYFLKLKGTNVSFNKKLIVE